MNEDEDYWPNEEERTRSHWWAPANLISLLIFLPLQLLKNWPRVTVVLLLGVIIWLLAGCKNPPLHEAQYIREVRPVKPAPYRVAEAKEPIEADLVWKREDYDVQP